MSACSMCVCACVKCKADLFVQVQHDVFSNDLPAPKLPAKVSFQPPAPKETPSQVPQPAQATLSSLDPLQSQRLQNDAAQAGTMETELRKVTLLPLLCCVDLYTHDW